MCAFLSQIQSFFICYSKIDLCVSFLVIAEHSDIAWNIKVEKISMLCISSAQNHHPTWFIAHEIFSLKFFFPLTWEIKKSVWEKFRKFFKSRHLAHINKQICVCVVGGLNEKLFASITQAQASKYVEFYVEHVCSFEVAKIQLFFQENIKSKEKQVWRSNYIERKRERARD